MPLSSFNLDQHLARSCLYWMRSRSLSNCPDHACVDSLRKNLSEFFAGTSAARVNGSELSCFATIICKAFSRPAVGRERLDGCDLLCHLWSPNGRGLIRNPALIHWLDEMEDFKLSTKGTGTTRETKSMNITIREAKQKLVRLCLSLTGIVVWIPLVIWIDCN